MLGFGEGEGREKEKREERQSFFCAYVFLYLGFYWVLEKVFLGLFIYSFHLCFFFKYCADMENCSFMFFF